MESCEGCETGWFGVLREFPHRAALCFLVVMIVSERNAAVMGGMLKNSDVAVDESGQL